MPRTPTLEELLDRLRSDYAFRESFREVYRRVAAGERNATHPPLPVNVVVFACQAMVTLIDHVNQEAARNRLPPEPPPQPTPSH